VSASYEYVPPTSEVRFAFVERSSAMPFKAQRRAAFDQWLNNELAKAWARGYEDCFDFYGRGNVPPRTKNPYGAEVDQ